jgi:hypothetical protein
MSFIISKKQEDKHAACWMYQCKLKDTNCTILYTYMYIYLYTYRLAISYSFPRLHSCFERCIMIRDLAFPNCLKFCGCLKTSESIRFVTASNWFSNNYNLFQVFGSARFAMLVQMSGFVSQNNSLCWRFWIIYFQWDAN